MLEPIPCRIKMLVSFLEDLTLIIFDDSLKFNQQLVSTGFNCYNSILQDFMYKKDPYSWSSFVIYICKNII